VKYILVCLEVFTKHVALYPLRTATTRSCLKKITTNYIEQVIKPQEILSDHGSQFTSPLWKNTLHDLGINVKFSPIRHPESNPAERFMKELGKYFRIYCHQAHKQWPELIPFIQDWMNKSISSVTGYSPIELLGREARDEVFKQIIQKLPERPTDEDVPSKILQAYVRMKSKAGARKAKRNRRKHEWEPQVGDLVLIRGQPLSSAVQGIIGKFQRLYEGPFGVKRIVNPSLYELQSVSGQFKGLYHITHLKPYIQGVQNL
jgi:hypothetical protein